MCGRARCTLSPDAVTQATGAGPNWRNQHLFRPSFNVAPGTFLPVVRASDPPSASAHATASAKDTDGAAKRCAETEGDEAEVGARGETEGELGKGAVELRTKGEGEGEYLHVKAEHNGHREGEGEGEAVRGEGEAHGEGEEHSKGGVKVEGEGEVERGDMEVQVMKWGLIPSFTNKTQKPDHFRMFNARCESLHAKPSFRRLLPARRCLVLLDGFYEWKKEGFKKQPFYIHMSDDRPMLMAGLFDSWRDEEGEELFTFTIVTTASSEQLQWLHDRMPVILPSRHLASAWLRGELSTPQAIASLCTPYNHCDLVWHAVTPQLGKTSFDGPQCVEPLPLKPAPTPITQFFARKRQKLPPTATGDGGGGSEDVGQGGECEGGGSKGDALELAAVRGGQDEAASVDDGGDGRVSEGGEKESGGDGSGDGNGDVKHEDVKHEDVKHEDVKHEDVKHEDVKHEDVKHEDVKHVDVKHEDGKHEDGDESAQDVASSLGEGDIPLTPLHRDIRAHSTPQQLPAQPEQPLSPSPLPAAPLLTPTASKASPLPAKKQQLQVHSGKAASKRRKGPPQAVESGSQLSIRRFFSVPQ